MPEPPPRKRFQIHLSTAIVLMFVAGGLIWVNILERNGHDYGGEEAYEFHVRNEFVGRGWPFAYSVKYIRSMYPNGDPFFYSSGNRRGYFTPIAMVFDVCVALLLILFIAQTCEHLIRRRAARKEP